MDGVMEAVPMDVDTHTHVHAHTHVHTHADTHAPASVDMGSAVEAPFGAASCVSPPPHEFSPAWQPHAPQVESPAMPNCVPAHTHTHAHIHAHVHSPALPPAPGKRERSPEPGQATGVAENASGDAVPAKSHMPTPARDVASVASAQSATLRTRARKRRQVEEDVWDWVCCVCGGLEAPDAPAEPDNPDDPANVLLSCEGGCLRSVHGSCVGASAQEITALKADDKPWICDDCTNNNHPCALCNKRGHRQYAPIMRAGRLDSCSDTAAMVRLLRTARVDLDRETAALLRRAVGTSGLDTHTSAGCDAEQFDNHAHGLEAVVEKALRHAVLGRQSDVIRAVAAKWGIKLRPEDFASKPSNAAATASASASAEPVTTIQDAGGRERVDGAPAGRKRSRQAGSVTPSDNAAVDDPSAADHPGSAEMANGGVGSTKAAFTGESKAAAVTPRQVIAGAPLSRLGTPWTGTAKCAHRKCGRYYHFACLRQLCDAAVMRAECLQWRARQHARSRTSPAISSPPDDTSDPQPRYVDTNACTHRALLTGWDADSRIVRERLMAEVFHGERGAPTGDAKTAAAVAPARRMNKPKESLFMRPASPVLVGNPATGSAIDGGQQESISAAGTLFSHATDGTEQGSVPPPITAPSAACDTYQSEQPSSHVDVNESPVHEPLSEETMPPCQTRPSGTSGTGTDIELEASADHASAASMPADAPADDTERRCSSRARKQTQRFVVELSARSSSKRGRTPSRTRSRSGHTATNSGKRREKSLQHESIATSQEAWNPREIPVHPPVAVPAAVLLEPFSLPFVGAEPVWLAPRVSQAFLCPAHACDTCELGEGGVARSLFSEVGDHEACHGAAFPGGSPTENHADDHDGTLTLISHMPRDLLDTRMAELVVSAEFDPLLRQQRIRDIIVALAQQRCNHQGTIYLVTRQASAVVKSLFSRRLKRGCLMCPRTYHESCTPPGATGNAYADLCPYHANMALPGEHPPVAGDDDLATAPAFTTTGQKSGCAEAAAKLRDLAVISGALTIKQPFDSRHFRCKTLFIQEVYTKPPTWQMLKKNNYVSRVKPDWPDADLCLCATRSIARDALGRVICDDNCMNRALRVECFGGGANGAAPTRRAICSVGPHCTNRALQMRSSPRFRLAPAVGKGWGLIADEEISAGTFIIEYVGEVIDEAMQQARLEAAAARHESHHYLMEIDANQIIDARVKGNHARFINHSCEPNCELQRWNVEGYTRIGVFAIRDIPKGEELTYDYQFFTAESTACMCGAPSCRKFLGANIAKDVEHQMAMKAAARRSRTPAAKPRARVPKAETAKPLGKPKMLQSPLAVDIKPSETNGAPGAAAVESADRAACQTYDVCLEEAEVSIGSSDESL